MRPTAKEELVETQEAKEEQVSAEETLYAELAPSNFSTVADSEDPHLVFF